MYIIRPNVELWKPIDHAQHVAKCASVCYGSKGKRTPDKEKDIRLVKQLLDSGHKSVFRHDTLYYVIPFADYSQNDDLHADIIVLQGYNAYVNIIFGENNDCYISVNGQWAHENDWFVSKYVKYSIEEKDLRKYPEALAIRRFTFCITTQISTSREFNRVSPNAITEESTRYCNYCNDKFDNNVSICQPFWLDVFATFEKMRNTKSPVEQVRYNGKNISAYVDDKLVTIPFSQFNIEIVNDKRTEQNAKTFLGFVHKHAVHYHDMLKYGLIAQEARELLPLCTATTVIYTYSLYEWIRILLLRFYGVTGAPHPNAFIIAREIKELLELEGYDVDDLAYDVCKLIYNKELKLK